MTWKLFQIKNIAIVIDDVVYDRLNRILPLSVFVEVVKWSLCILSAVSENDSGIRTENVQRIKKLNVVDDTTLFSYHSQLSRFLCQTETLRLLARNPPALTAASTDCTPQDEHFKSSTDAQDRNQEHRVQLVKYQTACYTRND